MKKWIMILAGALLPLVFFAQETPLSSVFDEYMGKKGFKAEQIFPGETSMEWEAEMETNEIRKVMDNIKSIRIVSTQGEEGGSRKALSKSIENALERADYTELITVKSGDESVNMYGLKLASGNLREFALVVREPDEVFLFTMTGDMDFSDIIKDDLMKEAMKVGEKYKGEKACDK